MLLGFCEGFLIPRAPNTKTKKVQKYTEIPSKATKTATFSKGNWSPGDLCRFKMLFLFVCDCVFLGVFLLESGIQRAFSRCYFRFMIVTRFW